MPSTYAHYRFGRTVLEGLPEDCRAVIRAHPELYHLGLHGPDLLFFDHPLRSTPVNRMGYAIHGRPGADFFAPAAERLEGLGNPPAHLAYLYGVLCHFALDRACHGYIGQVVSAGKLRHSEIETEFDRMLMELDGLDPLRHDLSGHIRPSQGSARVIALFYPPLTANQVCHAEQSFRRYIRLLNAPGRARREGLRALLGVHGSAREIRGMVMPSRPNPLCRETNQMLQRFYVHAVPEARRLIGDWRDTSAGRLPWDGLYRYDFEGRLLPQKEEDHP